MLDLLDKAETETTIGIAAKRALIEAELQKNPQRSDRKIAEAVGHGICHKTVGAARERLGIASPLGNSPQPPTPTEHRQMLINAGKDFDAKHPPESAEEVVDRMIAEGKLGHATAGRGGMGDAVAELPNLTVQAAVDQCHGHIQRIREERQAKAAEEDEANGEQTMVRSQREVTIQFDDSTGEWVIKQKNWPDDDGAIYINEEHMQAFLDALCDRLGIASIRGSN
jgi:hypothetical protein